VLAVRLLARFAGTGQGSDAIVPKFMQDVLLQGAPAGYDRLSLLSTSLLRDGGQQTGD
jgi:hypothetical protein